MSAKLAVSARLDSEIELYRVIIIDIEVEETARSNSVDGLIEMYRKEL